MSLNRSFPNSFHNELQTSRSPRTAFVKLLPAWMTRNSRLLTAPAGWPIRQVIHQVPDSHLNSYVRFKLAVTESEPTIKPYDERKWAELPDARFGPVEPSLQLLESLHLRWVAFLRSLSPADFSRKFNHPGAAD